MSEKSLVPEAFGPLQGVRIVNSGLLIAAPFASELAAEMGAEVIQVERPGVGDVGWRTLGITLETHNHTPLATNWIQERRNLFGITLDASKPRGRELFLKLLERTEIWIEGSKPGTYPKFGLDDETVHKVNPKLVIVHVSGYGQTGDPDYVSRASYDSIGQAYAGMMYQTGYPETPPTRAAPWTGDYLTALFALWSSLAGLTYARAHGKGQSIDVALFESVHRTMGGTMIEYFQKKFVRERSGNQGQGFQPLDSFPTSDGWVMMGAIGEVYNRLVDAIGLDSKDPKWQSARTNLGAPEGIEFDTYLRGWIAQRTTAEVNRILNAAQVPCSTINSSKDIAEDPHFKARDMQIEWDDPSVGHVKGIGVSPKFSLTPGKVWRGAPTLGQDNRFIYGEVLGVSSAEMESLARDQVI